MLRKEGFPRPLSISPRCFVDTFAFSASSSCVCPPTSRSLRILNPNSLFMHILSSTHQGFFLSKYAQQIREHKAVLRSGFFICLKFFAAGTKCRGIWI